MYLLVNLSVEIIINGDRSNLMVPSLRQKTKPAIMLTVEKNDSPNKEKIA